VPGGSPRRGCWGGPGGRTTLVAPGLSRALLASQSVLARRAWCAGRLATRWYGVASIERTWAVSADPTRSVTLAAGAACQSRSKASASASACRADNAAPPRGAPGTQDISITGGRPSRSARTGSADSPGAHSASNVRAAHSRSASPRSHDRNRLVTTPRPASTSTSCVQAGRSTMHPSSAPGRAGSRLLPDRSARRSVQQAATAVQPAPDFGHATAQVIGCR
jgi:hypothetical protein